MKKIVTFLTLVSAIVFGTVTAQTKSGLVEKTYTDLGKVNDFKASMLTVKDLSTSSKENKLVLEYKAFGASDTRFVEFTKSELNDLVKGMTTINTTYPTAAKVANVELAYTTGKGLEIGYMFEVAVEKVASTPTTKKEKYYIETKEKYYEGKIVNSDQSGTYIWKEVSGAAVAKEVVGKWVPFIKMYNSTSKNTTSITVDEYNVLLKFFEESNAKI
ncbi:MAG: hypothetical protein V4622_05730 [Bacteroidota bacterium]